MHKCAAFLAAAALASCAGEQETEVSSAFTGSDEFRELVEDARTAARAGDLALAGRFYDQAIALEPDNPGLWVDIARLRFRGGEHLSAIEAAEYAVELGPNYAPALLLRAQMVRDAKGLAEALPWFEAAILADPDNTDVLADYAATLGDLGRYSDMLAAVRNLADIVPDHPQVHYLQAVLAARAGDPVLAGSLLARSNLSEEGVPAAMMLDALVNLQQGTHGTAASILERLAEQQPGNMRVNELLAKAWWLGGRDREIVDRYEAFAQEDAASPYLVMLVARSLERMGERERALPLIGRARRFDNGDPVLLALHPSLPGETQQLRKSAQAKNAGDLERLGIATLELFPASGDAHHLAGDAAFLAGQTARAGELYAVSAQVRGAWPLTRKLIETYRLQGAEDAADALLLRSVAGEPNNIDALLLLAKRSAASEDWLRVDVLLDTATNLGAGSDPRLLRLRADAARGLGRNGDAERFETILRDLRPGDFIAD
jgi:tetratricopeptide (TPR) repeat protein